MDAISLLDDVLGPIMRGPSSSHTAGAYRLGKIARSVCGERPASVTCTFDPEGSYAATYQPLGVDLAFVSGILGLDLVSEQFFDALELARAEGMQVEFRNAPLPDSDHPNAARIDLTSQAGTALTLLAQSVGGGAVELRRINDWPALVTGRRHDLLIEVEQQSAPALERCLAPFQDDLQYQNWQERSDQRLYHPDSKNPFPPELHEQLRHLEGVTHIWPVEPLTAIVQGTPLFSSAEAMVALAEERGCSLGELGIEYECQLLARPRIEIVEAMLERLRIMQASVAQGRDPRRINMLLTYPSAGRIMQAEAAGQMAIGGLHSRAAARAMAAMHVSNSMGVVCAAPTGGSAGVLPGVLTTLIEERDLVPTSAASALFAAAAIGLIIAQRATFAAEICGCQVEIGAAGAMAAAAVVDVAGGTAQQAADAAAIALHNTMGSVCDPVQGGCEIPCHTRNAVAASSAFVCADLILGGYYNPIPLDETIDASFAVGQMLPPELRCTARGGIAVAPSAQALPRLR